MKATTGNVCCFVLLCLFVSSSFGEKWKLSITEIGQFPVLTILVGDSVIWINDDFENIHSTVSTTESTPWNSGVLYFGDRFQFTFDSPGIYTYSCSIHTQDTGTIYVFESDAYFPDDTSVDLSTIANSAPLAEGEFTSLNLAPSAHDGSHITLFQFPPGQPPASSRGLPSSYAIYNGEVYYVASSDAKQLRSTTLSSPLFVLISAILFIAFQW